VKVLFALAALAFGLSAPALAGTEATAAAPAAPALINGFLTPYEPLAGTPCFACVVATGTTTKAIRSFGLGLPVYAIPLSLAKVGVLSYFQASVSTKCVIKITATVYGRTVPVITSAPFNVYGGHVAWYNLVISRPVYHGVGGTFSSQYICGTFKSNISSQEIYLL
jgi:hypothetical protein